MDKHIQDKDGHWSVDFRYGDTRYRKRGFKSYKAAKQYYGDIVGNRYEPPTQSLSATVNEYLSWSENIKRKSPKTMRSDRQRLGVFLQWANTAGVKSAIDITVDAVRDFQKYYFEKAPFTGSQNHRRTQSSPSATWEKYHQNVSAFSNWCVSRKLMESNPLARAEEFKVKSHRTRPSTFTSTELKKLFGYLDSLQSHHISAIFRLLAYTGCRLSEATELEWRNVDFETGELVFERTKNYENRSVPISQQLRPYLEKLLTGTVYVFDNGNNCHLYHDNYYWKLLREATTVCGLKHRPVHAFRHTFCSQLAEADVNLATIKDLAGHKNIATTLKYLQFTEAKQRDAIARLPY